MDLIAFSIASGAGVGVIVAYGLNRLTVDRVERERHVLVASVLAALRELGETETTDELGSGAVRGAEAVTEDDPRFIDCGIEVVNADGRVVGTALIPAPPVN